MRAINLNSNSHSSKFLIKSLIVGLIFGYFNLNFSASREYRSKKFFGAVITGQALGEVTGWLDRGADIDYFGDLGSDAVVKDKYNWRGTALHWAAKHNQAKLAAILLTRNADRMVHDSDDKAPFRYAQHKKLKKLLYVEPVPKDLAADLGFKRHINRFGFGVVPAGWDMDSTSPSTKIA